MLEADRRQQPLGRTRRFGRVDATALRTDAAIETRRIAATLGKEARSSRKRRRRTQASVASEVGISRSRYAELERGEGAMAPLDTWIRIGLVLDRPIALSMARELDQGLPADAGHLAAQEWVLDHARRYGRTPDVELQTRPGPDVPVADVVVRDDPNRTLALIEISNRLDDFGAALRAYDRKLPDMDVLASAAGGDRSPYRVAAAWLLGCWSTRPRTADSSLAIRRSCGRGSRGPPSRSSERCATVRPFRSTPRSPGSIRERARFDRYASPGEGSPMGRYSMTSPSGTSSATGG